MSDIRNNLKNAKRKARPIPNKRPPLIKKITKRSEDYPSTGAFFKEVYYQQIYEEKCGSCGRTLRVQGQRDNGSPEYESVIFVQCICGEGVGFGIPVN